MAFPPPVLIIIMAKKYNGMELIPKISIKGKLIGYGLIAIGAATIALPTGSIAIIIAGIAFVNGDGDKVIKTAKFKLSEFPNFLHGNRNLKLIKQNIRVWFMALKLGKRKDL